MYGERSRLQHGHEQLRPVHRFGRLRSLRDATDVRRSERCMRAMRDEQRLYGLDSYMRCNDMPRLRRRLGVSH